MEFIWPIKVYYEDTDAGGVVYYANYLKFCERARSEWLNNLGVDQAQLLADDIAFAVKSAQIDYFKPARLNDDLEVISEVVSIKGASLTFKQTIYLKQPSHKLGVDVNTTAERNSGLVENKKIKLITASIEVVCLTLNSFTPCRIPATVRKELQRVS